MTEGTSTSLRRRQFLDTLGATMAAAGGLAGRTPAAAEKAAENAAPLNIIDFHNHYVGPAFPLTTLASAPPALRSYWEGVNRKLRDPGSLMSSIEQAG